MKKIERVDRIFSLDLLKAISIVGVVSFHSIFVSLSTSISYQMDVLSAPLRACVPILFTISFLLFEQSLNDPKNSSRFSLLRKRFVRIAIPTVFWFSVGIAVIVMLKIEPINLTFIYHLLRGEVFPGAYYLIVMLQCLPVFVLLNRWFADLRNVLKTIGLQLLVFIFIYISLSGFFGANTIYILRHIYRSIAAYWFVYMALGAYFYDNWLTIKKISKRISTPLKLLLLSLTSLIMIAERVHLYSITEGKVVPFEYIMFSCILSVVVVFLCFASVEEDQLPLPIIKLVHLLSKYSLGIFCINGILHNIFSNFGNYFFKEYSFSLTETLAMELIGWVLLLVVSLRLSILVEQLGLRACVR